MCRSVSLDDLVFAVYFIQIMLTQEACEVAVNSYCSETDKVILYWLIFVLRHGGKSKAMDDRI